MRLYLVPEGRLFMWPTNKVGHITSVPGCSEGRAKALPPVLLETINLEPRVFRVRNFLSAAEVDGPSNLRVFPPCAPSSHAQGSSGVVATVLLVWRGHTKSLATRARPSPGLAVWLE